MNALALNSAIFLATVATSVVNNVCAIVVHVVTPPILRFSHNMNEYVLQTPFN